ncbi:syntaxin-32-like [Dioscorea cayenensis subsp. rotundata]|uniref:Syntaxin-32-like n=1 Tax=Dioscorea cayennensis subsp. rotundata TaxID=55577 RepID=A0AB40AQU5_DIOCR|nr:syntaxin-32-like [Dioscorea cayenensis subsp. rotundata]
MELKFVVSQFVLQVPQNTELADMDSSKDRVAHATTIRDDLKSRLMGATKQFKDVLTNLKTHENRNKIFSTNASRENPLMHQPKIVSEPAPWYKCMIRGSISTPPVNPDQEVERTFKRRLCQISLMKTGYVEISVEMDQGKEMAGNHQQSISDFAQPNLEGVGSSIVHPPIVANNFELKPNFI